MKLPDEGKALYANPIGRWATQLAKVSEGSKVGIMSTLLAGFSSYIGSDVRVVTGKGSMPLSMWLCLIGTSGKSRKGTATGIGVQVLETAFKAWGQDGIVHGLPGTGLGLVTELSEHMDDEHNAQPLCFVEEELDIVISAMRRDIKIGVMLRKSFDGASLRHKTSVTDIMVKNPHFGIIANCQPRNFGAVAGGKDATGGTWNRWLPVAVTRGQKLPVFDSPDPGPVIKSVAKALRKAASLAREVSEVKVPKAVANKFEQIHREAVEALTDTDNEMLAAMCERSLAQLVKLAALYALADCRESINIKDFDSALALIQYSVSTVREILPEETGGPSPAQRLIDALKANGGEMTRSEVQDVFSHNLSAKQLDQLLLGLPQVQITKGRVVRGRPPVVYRLTEQKETVAA